MVRANKRNEALRIESALLNKIAMLGTEKTAEAVGVDKSQISRWKRDWIPKFSMLLAVLEWGVVDDDMARLARQVASILTNKNARRQPSVLIKYKWNFNNIQRGNYMRNKGFNPPDTHKEAKRLRFLRSIDERTQISFVKVARTELLKAEARALLPSLPKEEGYTFIPNAFLEKLLKEDISVSQFNDVLKVFRQGR